MTCRVLSLNSVDYLLKELLVDRRLPVALGSQIPPEIELLRPDGGKVHVVQF
jgi:hypothetical protein